MELNNYTINDKKIAKTSVKSEFGRLLLSDEFNASVSFKQLLNVFARRYGKTYYSNALTQQGRSEQDYYQVYTNLALLGLDTDLVAEKFVIKEKLNKLEKARQVIEGYEKLLDESNVKDLKDELEKLIKDKENFIVAENYNQFKKDADGLTKEINELRNKLHSFENTIARKLDSLEHSKSVDIDIDEITRIYREIEFFFEEKVSIRLDEAQEFHSNIMNSRISRLEAEACSLRNSARELETVINEKGKERDSILKDLNSKGALEEYNSISERIRTRESEIQELEKYKKILVGFKLDKTKFDLENAQLNARSIEYLTEAKDHLETVENKFRAIVKEFYKNHGGSLRVTQTVDAKYLFNIDVSVPQDGSQGIGEVKIFCYDFLLYQLNPDLLSFIAHDGCIFSEMDERQKAMIFKVALKYIHGGNLQYFVNIGQSSLDEVLDKENKFGILSELEKKEVRESIILKLYDKNPSAWLFGSSFG